MKINLNKAFQTFKVGVAAMAFSATFLSFSLVLPAKVSAQSTPGGGATTTDPIQSSTCEGIKLATGGECEDSGNASFSNLIKKVINILSILVGAVSVIMLIIGGFRYIISNGDSNSTKSAKDTIMYALIGLIIVLFAQIIVRFVWTNATNTTSSITNTQVLI
jgi:hypothetical protein